MNKRKSYVYLLIVIFSFWTTHHLLSIRGLEAEPVIIWEYFFPDIGQDMGPGVNELTISKVAEKVVALSNLPSITCFNLVTGDIIWEIDPVTNLTQPRYTRAYEVAIDDFTGDGTQDLMVAGGVPSGAVYDDPNATITGFIVLLDLETGDIKWIKDNFNDTVVNLLVGNFLSGTEIDVALSQTTQLFLLDGGTGMVHWEVPIENNTTSVTGYLELINNNQAASNDILVWYESIDILFAVYDGKTGEFLWDVNYGPRGSGITDLLVTDLTGDAADDIIFSLSDRDGLIAYNGETRTLLWEVTGFATGYLDSGDLYQNGTNYVINTFLENISLFQGSSGRQVYNKIIYSGDWSTDIYAVDLDLDGVAELISPSWGKSISVLNETGDLLFLIPIGGWATSLVFANVLPDAYPELIIGSNGNGWVGLVSLGYKTNSSRPSDIFQIGVLVLTLSAVSLTTIIVLLRYKKRAESL